MGMALDEPQKNEQPLQVNGIDVLADDSIRQYLEGTVIDYVKRPDAEGFIIEASGGCC